MRAPPADAGADSLKLSVLNAVAAITVRTLEATGIYESDLLGVGVPLFLAPTLAVMALVFARRDLRDGWKSAVEGAMVLTFVALVTSWWPLLAAD